jgi:hypothetical protein
VAGVRHFITMKKYLLKSVPIIFVSADALASGSMFSGSDISEAVFMGIFMWLAGAICIGLASFPLALVINKNKPDVLGRSYGTVFYVITRSLVAIPVLSIAAFVLFQMIK